MKQPKIFKIKPESYDVPPTLKQVKENEQMRKIFSLLVSNRMSVNADEWFGLADSIFGNVEELTPDVIEQIDRSRILERVDEVRERVGAFQEFLRTKQNQEALLEIAQKSHTGLGALLRTFGEDGIFDYLRNENNCLSVAINNPKVLDDIIHNVISFRQVEKRAQKRDLDFKETFKELAGIVLGESKEDVLATARGVKAFSSVFLGWIKTVDEKSRKTSASRLQAKARAGATKQEELQELRAITDINKLKAKEYTEAFKAGELETLGAREVGDAVVASGSPILGFVQSWLNHQLQTAGAEIGNIRKRVEIGKYAKEIEQSEFARLQRGAKTKQEIKDYTKELERSEFVRLQGEQPEVWTDVSFSEVVELGGQVFSVLKKIWKENSKTVLESEKWDKLASNLVKTPGALIDKVRKMEARRVLSKAAGEDFGKEQAEFKKMFSVDLSISRPFEDIVEQKEIVEKRLFISFNPSKKEPGAVDQAKQTITSKDWLEFLNQPGKKRLKDTIDEIRRNFKGKDLLSLESLKNVSQILVEFGSEKELREIGGVKVLAKWSWEEVENFLIQQLKKKNLDRWTDHCLRRCGVEIGAKGDAWRTLSVMAMRKKVQDQLQPYVDKLTY